METTNGISRKSLSTLNYAVGIASCLAAMMQIAVPLFKHRAGGVNWGMVGFNVVAGIVWFLIGIRYAKGVR